MHRAQPVSNRICDSKWKERQYRLHKLKLKQMRPSIDTRTPAQFLQTRSNAKKAQQEEDRIAQITRNNRILLRKMTEIMQKNQLDNYNNIRPRSLNKEYRKRELMRITSENQAILKRIQQRDANYNHVQWEDERKRNERYCRSICQYPYVLAAVSKIEGEAGGSGGAGPSAVSAAAYSQELGQGAIAEEARRIREMIQKNRADAEFADSMSTGTDSPSGGSPVAAGKPAAPSSAKFESAPSRHTGETDVKPQDSLLSLAVDAADGTMDGK